MSVADRLWFWFLVEIRQQHSACLVMLVVLVVRPSLFKVRLDTFEMHQDVKHHYTANLTGVCDRSVDEFSDS